MNTYLLYKSLSQFNRISKIFLFFASVLMIFGCANREIQELQTSVNDLERKLNQYQMQTERETADVSQTVQKSFQELGYTQSSLESTLNQIANRLSVLERDVARLQERANRQENFTGETATLVQDVQQSTIQLQEKVDSIQGQVNQFSNQFSEFQQESRNADRQNQAQMNRIRDVLSSQIDQMETTTREMYSQILKELGASVPAPTAEERAASDLVHVVESGDTLSSIAQNYGVSSNVLQEYNGITDPSRIYVGQKIRIP